MASTIPPSWSPRPLSPEPPPFADEDLRLKLNSATGTQRRVAVSLSILLMLVNIAALSMSENEPFCIVLNAVIMFSCLPVLLGSCTASSRVLTASLAFLSASIALSLAYLIVIVTSDEEDWNIILQIVAFVLLMLIAASVYDARQWMMREQAAERMQESQASVPLAEAAAPTSSSSTPSLTPRRVTFLPPSAVRSLSGHSSFSLSRGGALGQAIEIQGAPNRPRSPSLRQGLSDASSSSSSSSVAAESKSDMV